MKTFKIRRVKIRRVFHNELKSGMKLFKKRKLLPSPPYN